MADTQQAISDLKKEVEGLKEKVKAARKEKADTTLAKAAERLSSFPRTEKIRVRRTLKGHLSKVYAMHWAVEKNVLVSAAQEGQLIVWEALSTAKLAAIPLRSARVTTCAFSPSAALVASGGLDNLCTVYNLHSKEIPVPVFRELSGHNGFLASCRFLNDKQIISASGDKTCALWDIEAGKLVTSFAEHGGDAVALSVHPADKNLFVSGACDKTAKLWDIRSGQSSQTFEGHTNDVNAVQFFPNGNAVGTGSEDKSCKLFDLRADRDVQTYTDDSLKTGVTSIAFSLSGRFLFAGYDDNTCYVFDALKGERLWGLAGHTNRVSCLGVSADGKALCTGSWDTLLKIWA